MKVIKVRNVVKDKTYVNYYLQLENGRKIRINGVFEDDKNALKTIAYWENE